MLWSGLLLIAGCAGSGSPSVSEHKLKRAGLINAQLGIDYMQQGHLNRAYSKLKLALSQNPTSSDVLNAYALLMERLGENDKARQYFERALSVKPRDSSIRNNYGVFLCSIKQYQAAQEQFRKALKNPLYRTPQYAIANEGICYLREGKNRLAKAKFQLALQKQPHYIPALYNLMRIAVKEKKWSTASQYIQLMPMDFIEGSPYLLGQCLIINRKVENMNFATQCARILYRKYPNSHEAKQLLDSDSTS